MSASCLALILMAPSGPVVLSQKGDTYTLDARRLDEALEDMSALGRQARIFPHYKNGAPTGYKLVGIRAKSLFEQLGLRNGDVVTHLHGQPFTSPAAALEAWSTLRAARRVELGVNRRGEALTLVYEVVGEGRVEVPAAKYTAPRPPPRPPAMGIEIIGRMTGSLDVLMAADAADGEVTVDLPKVVLRNLGGAFGDLELDAVRVRLRIEGDATSTHLRMVEVEASGPAIKITVDPTGSEIQKHAHRTWPQANFRLKATIEMGSSGLKVAFECNGYVERPRCRLK